MSEDKNNQDPILDQTDNTKDELKSIPSTIWKFIISIFSFSNEEVS